MDLKLLVICMGRFFSPFSLSFLFFKFFCGSGVSTHSLHLESFHQPFFVMGIFEIGSGKLFAQG
jgi:hypothetical protein